MTEVLANAVWHALTGAQADRGVRRGDAARFAEDLSPFAALADADDPGAWDDLAELVGPGSEAALFRDDFSVAPGWRELWRGEGVQMVASGPVGEHRPPVAAEIDVVELDEKDAPAMAALVERTQPGPWTARTHTLGPFIGARVGDRLVAMAGSRMHPGPYQEISAVCTDADWRARGIAGVLVSHLAAGIRERDEIPFLHTAGTNRGAIRLYRDLGFEPRRSVTFGVVVAPGEPNGSS